MKIDKVDIILDSEALVLLLVGRLRPDRVSSTKKTTAYTQQDFNDLEILVSLVKKFYITPQIVTEVDNHLNEHHQINTYKYIQMLKTHINTSIEVTEPSKDLVQDDFFNTLGISDSAILRLAKDKKLTIISGDSALCDIAESLKIPVYDLKRFAQKNFS